MLMFRETLKATVLVCIAVTCIANPLSGENSAEFEGDIRWDETQVNNWEEEEEGATPGQHENTAEEEDTDNTAAKKHNGSTNLQAFPGNIMSDENNSNTFPENIMSDENNSNTSYSSRIWQYKTSDNAGSMTYTIPYDTSRMTDPQAVVYARIAMKEWGRGTCILFVPRTTESDFISLRPGNSCSSHVGRVGGEQFVTVSPGCQYDRGLLMHELGHVLGLFHEHTRPDRDQYVEIIKANLIPGIYDTNFKKMAHSPSYVKPGNYDYLSVMHYGQNHFSKPPYNLTTIRTLDPAAQSIIGQRTVLSSLDVEKVNTMYNCDCKIVNTTNTYTRRYWGECSFLFFKWRCVKEEEVTEILSRKVCIDLTRQG